MIDTADIWYRFVSFVFWYSPVPSFWEAQKMLRQSIRDLAADEEEEDPDREHKEEDEDEQGAGGRKRKGKGRGKGKKGKG